jgi:CBS domain-containing protein
MMADHQIRRIPVVQNGEMIGICAIGDLIGNYKIIHC